MDISKKIISLRELKGWSQAEFAKRVGLNKSVMNRIEKGERPVRDQELLVISSVLGVSADYLLGSSSNKEISSIDEDEVMFRKWAKDSETGAFFSEILESEEAEIEELREIWEIMKKRRKEK